ncbi:Nucleolar pre-ribosomal-associated protein 1 [Strongyloides ratti]|uniref:Nucleolar pre-ribosomal-associated protein 1 n=1 Tax=Strongyloides ratti TaxID=34506 RepID=A0A090MZ76_STRRB|nr:Nucleolar pre-ribosomal-associated protein 1 [Strongyloides ratti]CEF68449.1 Nucleolar pre-ribosomal-associated protein 1 [Strongyloides ratti]
MVVMSDSDDDDIKSQSKFERLKLELVNEFRDTTKIIKKIWKFVNKHIDSDEERNDIINVCEKLDFIPLLLFNYTEENYGISLSKFMPFSIGEKAKDYYENLQKLGVILHQRQSFSEAIDQLDIERMKFSIKTLSTISLLSKNVQHHVYDPRFLLRMFCTMLEPGSDLSLTSLDDSDLRGLGYVCLQRFFGHLNLLTTDRFETKRLIQQLIRLFKESVTSVNQKVPHIISYFFAKASIELYDPTSQLFSRIVNCVISSPIISFSQPLQFYNMLESCPADKPNIETEWILELLSVSIIDMEDFTILERIGGFKACLSLYGSEISSIPVRKNILILINNITSNSECSLMLLRVYNIHAWIIQVMINDKASNWECCFLSRIFFKICLSFKNYTLEGVSNADYEKMVYLSQSLKFVGSIILQKFKTAFSQQLNSLKDISQKLDNSKPEQLEELLNEEWIINKV